MPELPALLRLTIRTIHFSRALPPRGMKLARHAASCGERRYPRVVHGLLAVGAATPLPMPLRTSLRVVVENPEPETTCKGSCLISGRTRHQEICPSIPPETAADWIGQASITPRGAS